MASQTAQLFAAYMEFKDMKIQFLDEEQSVARVGFNLNNTEISVYIYFEEDDSEVHLSGHDFIKVPKGKEELIFRICNTCNNRYRWVRFVWDEENETLCCRCDALLQLDTCAEVIYDLMVRIVSIVDDAYPVFMKELWA